MLNLLIPLLAPVAGFLTFFGIVLLLLGLGGSRRADPMQQRLSDAARGGVMTLDDREMQASFYDRFFKPLAGGLSAFLARFTPAQSLENTQKRLLNAGLMGQMQVSDFIGMKGLSTIGALAVAGLLILLAHTVSVSAVLVIILFGLVGYFLPDLWLRSKTRQRKTAITNALPDSIDLLRIVSTSRCSPVSGSGVVSRRVSRSVCCPSGHVWARPRTSASAVLKSSAFWSS